MKKPQKQSRKEAIPTVLSENISRLMYEKRLKASDVYERLGVTRQMVYDYMKGKSVPGKEVLEKLSNILGVSVSALYSERGLTNEIKQETKETFVSSQVYVDSLKRQIELLEELLSAYRNQKK